MKYKLIKTYPGSPKLGTILTHEELQYCNWNEYYQEVVEKDYEILSFISCIECIFNKNSKNTFGQNCILYEDLINDKNFKIHSVKRLSDSEVFTVGDKTEFGDIIKYFEIDNKSNLLIIGYKDCEDILEFVKHSKQPLFTTEDGVDIFKNINKYYTPIYIVDKALNIRHCEKDFSVKPSENVKYFFNKEKAEEYILKHKPCLSLEDLKELGIFNETEYRNRMWISLKELVQQKLNK